MKFTNTWYEIKNPNDSYGLSGRFERCEGALKHINDSYQRAKERGYDNTHEKWIIVGVENVKEFDKNGEFLKEETVRYACEFVQFSFSDGEFVCAV